jgi:hypothetical protein
MNRPCSNCDKTLFSCEKSAIGFNQPKGEQLTPIGLWNRRDNLVRELIESLNLMTVTVSRTIGTELQEHLIMRELIKKIREVDDEWHLVVAQQGDNCLRIMHYDCNCNYNYRCDCRSRKDLHQNEKSTKN